MASFVSSNEALLPDQPLSYSSIPALEPLESVFARRESYAGPTNESNWVIPGRLLGKTACSGHGAGVARGLYLTFHLLWPHVGAAFGGYLLAVGAFPATLNDAETTTLLYSILAQGVSTFVCLQEEFVLRGVTEQLWRNGQVRA